MDELDNNNKINLNNNNDAVDKNNDDDDVDGGGDGDGNGNNCFQNNMWHKFFVFYFFQFLSLVSNGLLVGFLGNNSTINNFW